jgi:hypothetical protein
MKGNNERYPSLLQARLPREVIDAVDVAARANFVSRSQYVREALLRRLENDGAELLRPPVAA